MEISQESWHISKVKEMNDAVLQTKESGSGSRDRAITERQPNEITFCRDIGGYVFRSPYHLASEFVKRDDRLFELDPGFHMMRLVLDIDCKGDKFPFKSKLEMDHMIHKYLPEVVEEFQFHFRLEAQHRHVCVFDSSYFHTTGKPDDEHKIPRPPVVGCKLSVHVSFPFVVIRSLNSLKQVVAKMKTDDNLKNNLFFQWIDEKIYGWGRCLRVENQSKFPTKMGVGQTLDPISGAWNTQDKTDSWIGDYDNCPFTFLSQTFVYECERGDKRLKFVDEEEIILQRPLKNISDRAYRVLGDETKIGNQQHEQVLIAVQNIIGEEDRRFIESFLDNHRPLGTGSKIEGRIGSNFAVDPRNTKHVCHCGDTHRSNCSMLCIIVDKIRSMIGILMVICFATNKKKFIHFTQSTGVKNNQIVLEQVQSETHQLIKFNSRYLTQGQGFTLDRIFWNIFIVSVTGSGKSHAAGLLCQDETRTRILFISVRVTMKDDLVRRMTEYAKGTDMQILDYQQMQRDGMIDRVEKKIVMKDGREVKKMKTIYEFPERRFMFLCQIDSITKIGGLDLDRFDTVIIDEACSVLTRMMTLSKSVVILRQLIAMKRSQIIMMDALLCEKTIQMFQTIFDSKDTKSLTLINEFTLPIRYFQIDQNAAEENVSKFVQLEFLIRNLLKTGVKNMSISFDHLGDLKKCELFLLGQSNEYYNKHGCPLHVFSLCGDQSQREKSDKMKDINEALIGVNFFLYTQTVTVGIDVQRPEFQTHIAVYWGGTSSYIDQFQMLFRCRHTKIVFMICDGEPQKLPIKNKYSNKLYDWPVLGTKWMRCRKQLENLHQKTICDVVKFEPFELNTDADTFQKIKPIDRDFKTWVSEMSATNKHYLVNLVDDYLKLDPKNIKKFPEIKQVSTLDLHQKILYALSDSCFVQKIEISTLKKLFEFTRERHDPKSAFMIWCHNMTKRLEMVPLPKMSEIDDEVVALEVCKRNNLRDFQAMFEQVLKKIKRTPEELKKHGIKDDFCLSLKDLGMDRTNCKTIFASMMDALKPLDGKPISEMTDAELKNTLDTDKQFIKISPSKKIEVGSVRGRFYGVKIDCPHLENLIDSLK